MAISTFRIFGKRFTLLEAHLNALFMGIIGWMFGWYSLVLTTATVGNGHDNLWFITPTKLQNLGVVFAILLGVVSWLQRIASIQGDTTEQG